MPRKPEININLTKEEEEMLKGLTNLEREKYLAKKHDEIQEELDAAKLEKFNAENRGIYDINEDESEIAEKSNEIIENKPFVLSRELLAQGVFRSNFNLVKNCFVSVYINDGYEACKIIGIQKVEPYKLVGLKKQTQPIFCDLALNLDRDGVKKPVVGWPINNVSSRPLGVEAFHRFKMKFNITKESFEKIIAKYNNVIKEFNRHLTDQEITEAIERKSSANPKKVTNTQIKMKLIKRRDAAILRKDKEGAERFQRKLEKIEDKEYVERMKNVHDQDTLDEMMMKRKEASLTGDKNDKKYSRNK